MESLYFLSRCSIRMLLCWIDVGCCIYRNSCMNHPWWICDCSVVFIRIKGFNKKKKKWDMQEMLKSLLHDCVQYWIAGNIWIRDFIENWGIFFPSYPLFSLQFCCCGAVLYLVWLDSLIPERKDSKNTAFSYV